MTRPLVLVTHGAAAQDRSALATVRALAADGFDPAVTVSDRWSLAAASRWCRRVVPTPHPDDPGYAGAVEEECGTRPYVAVVPVSDAALLALGRPVEHLVDKQRLAQAAERVGLRTVPGHRVDTAEALRDLAGELDYPVVVKPLVSRVPTRRIDVAGQLAGWRPEGPVLVQPWVDGPMEAIAGVVHGGRLVAAVRQCYERTWPVDCGTSCAARLLERDPERERALVDLLEGYDGVFQAQFRGGHLLDCNPRPYGSLPLALAAGVNLVALHVRLVAGMPLPDAAPAAPPPRARYRWVEGDLRHVAHQMRAGRIGVAAAVGALLPRRHTAHSVVSWRDPRPALRRLRFAMGTRSTERR